MDPDVPWWIDPLVARLAEAVEKQRTRGDTHSADAIQVLVGARPGELRRSLAQLFAVNRDDEFFHPAKEIAHGFWDTPFVILGEPAATLEESTMVRLGVLADLSPPRLRQVNGVAHVLVSAVHAVKNPSRIEAGGPRDLNDPSDVVGVRYVASKRAAERGIRYQQMLHLKGAAAKVIGQFEAVFGRPHYVAAATLIELLTGTRLTPRELRTLIDR
jgi:hypothetical protein